MKTSPTQRSLKLLRDGGCTAQVVERWNPFAHVRQDLFGFIDIVAISGSCILGVQTTTAAHLAERIAKATALPAFRLWLSAGGLVAFHGWAKCGERGKRKAWKVTIRYARLMCDEVVIQ